MKNEAILILISFLFFINCQQTNNNTPLIDIDVLQIAYELAYNESYALKVLIKTINDLDVPVSFPAKFKSLKSNDEYKLSCVNVTPTDIECYTEKDVIFDISQKYYFAYSRGNDGKYTIEEKDNYQDWKHVNLIFKPKMYENLIMYRDHRKVIGLNDRKIVGGGYLYLVRNNKKLLHRPKDGFNHVFELNNFIIKGGIKDKIPPCTYASYKEAIDRGYRFIETNIAFTKDKVPVICNESDFETIYEKKGKISDMTLQELNKINLGKKYGKKYKGQKILLLEDLLKLCKENNILIDFDFSLSNLDYHYYFENTNEYAKIIIDTIEKNGMFNSVFFEEGSNEKIISKFIELKNDIAVSISNINSKIDMEKAKNKYPKAKRVIYNLGDISNNNQIDENIIKYGLSLGKKIKASTIDDVNIAKKLFSMGVNFITTNKIEPFYVENEYEEPILLKCTQFDVLVDCRLGQEVKLYDNAVYNIYYTTNIYKLYEDIVDKPISELKYLDTKQLDDRFYIINKFDFEKGDIVLNITFPIRKNKVLKGKVGPDFDNVQAPYLYDFDCEGNNLNYINCKINKNESVVKYNGNYSIHMVDYYSRNVTSKIKTTNSLFDFAIFRKGNKFFFYFGLILIVLVSVILICVFGKDKDSNKFSRIKIESSPFKYN